MNQTILFPLSRDALHDPHRWNSDWEIWLRGPHFALPHGPRNCFNAKLGDMQDTAHGVDEALEGYQAFVLSTCAIQRNITAEALQHFAEDNFEARWMTAGADVRGKHVLRAMAAVCSKARNLNEARAYCPELRVIRMRLDGKVFLGLLRSVMLEDASFIPSQPIFVSNPGWDAWAAQQRILNDTEAKKIALAEILILRTKLICKVSSSTRLH